MVSGNGGGLAHGGFSCASGCCMMLVVKAPGWGWGDGSGPEGSRWAGAPVHGRLTLGAGGVSNEGFAAFQFLLQGRPLGRSQGGFEGTMEKGAGNSFFPTGQVVAEVGSTAGSFACGVVDDVPFGGTHNAIQFPLGEGSTTDDAGALGDVFTTSFVGHGWGSEDML